MAAGMNAHIGKPIDMDLLCSILTRAQGEAANLAAD
jgi:hypothetical protein